MSYFSGDKIQLVAKINCLIYFVASRKLHNSWLEMREDVDRIYSLVRSFVTLLFGFIPLGVL